MPKTIYYKAVETEVYGGIVTRNSLYAAGRYSVLYYPSQLTTAPDGHRLFVYNDGQEALWAAQQRSSETDHIIEVWQAKVLQPRKINAALYVGHLNDDNLDRYWKAANSLMAKRRKVTSLNLSVHENLDDELLSDIATLGILHDVVVCMGVTLVKRIALFEQGMSITKATMNKGLAYLQPYILESAYDA